MDRKQRQTGAGKRGLGEPVCAGVDTPHPQNLSGQTSQPPTTRVYKGRGGRNYGHIAPSSHRHLEAQGGQGGRCGGHASHLLMAGTQHPLKNLS